MLEAGPAPQPPVQLNVAIGHVLGTGKPICGAVTLAPFGVLPPTTKEVGPLKTGMVASAAASASARPKPKMLLGVDPPNGTVLFNIKLCKSVRAVTLSTAPAAPFRRQALDCNRSAAMPATWGVAAELPKNGFSKLPAPVMETPSIAEISGLVRPSSVGPWLLKNSMVELVVSRHDSSGEMLVENTVCALSDAEQIAPTETTPTGEPPASPSAATLRVAVL